MVLIRDSIKLRGALKGLDLGFTTERQPTPWPRVRVHTKVYATAAGYLAYGVRIPRK